MTRRFCIHLMSTDSVCVWGKCIFGQKGSNACIKDSWLLTYLSPLLLNEDMVFKHYYKDTLVFPRKQKQKLMQLIL